MDAVTLFPVMPWALTSGLNIQVDIKLSGIPTLPLVTSSWAFHLYL